MKRKARRNPLVQDPSMKNAPDDQFEVGRLIIEHEGDESGEWYTYRDFDIRSRDYGDWDVIVLRSSVDSCLVWNDVLKRWRRQSTIEPIALGSGIRFVCVTRSNRRDSFYLFQVTNNTLRIYELSIFVQESRS